MPSKLAPTCHGSCPGSKLQSATEHMIRLAHTNCLKCTTVHGSKSATSTSLHQSPS